MNTVFLTSVSMIIIYKYSYNEYSVVPEKA